LALRIQYVEEPPCVWLAAEFRINDASRHANKQGVRNRSGTKVAQKQKIIQ